jgi:hypothetical protein
MLPAKRCLALSFSIVLLLALWGRVRCWTCDYISHTLPHLPYLAVVVGTLGATVLFWLGTQDLCTPRHPPSFHVAMGVVATFLGLTLLVTIRMSPMLHYVFAVGGYGGLLALLWWDTTLTQRQKPGLLVVLTGLFLLQSGLFVRKRHNSGAVAQLSLTLGLWAYLLCTL